MNERELSKKLEELAGRIEDSYHRLGDEELALIASELKKLSNITYSPGNSTNWKELKNQSKPTKNRYPF